MNEQQPHLEVFSRNRVNNSKITFVAVGIPSAAFSLLAIVALWPYRYIIAYILLVLVAFGAYYLVSLAMIHLRKKSVEANTIPLGPHGIVDATTGRVLPERQPLLLEPPQQEEDTQQTYTTNAVGILAMVSAGKTQDEAALAYGTNQTYVSRLVRRFKSQHNMV